MRCGIARRRCPALEKHTGMHGDRIGYVWSAPDTIAIAARVQVNTNSFASTYGQIATHQAVQEKMDAVILDRARRARASLLHVLRRLSDIGPLTISPPDGGYFLFADFSKCADAYQRLGYQRADQFLLQEATVATISGAFFAPGLDDFSHFVRINCGRSLEVLNEACSRLELAVQRLGIPRTTRAACCPVGMAPRRSRSERTSQMPAAQLSDRTDNRALEAQKIGANALDHHLDLFDRLTVRCGAASAYCAILEQVLGISLRQAVVSTSEHAAPFNFASSVSYVLPQLAIQQAGLRLPAPIVVLVSSLVPFDNRHYPRGFVLPDGRRFNLFANRVRKSCAMFQPASDAESLADGRPFLQAYPWLRPYLAKSAPFGNAADQIAAVMEAMAERWFAVPAAQIVIRSFEDTARQMLVRLLDTHDPWVERILLDSVARRFIAESLMGTFCAWGESHGSFLFWNRRGDRLGRFVERDGGLVDGDTRIPFTSEALARSLRTGAIWPGVFLCLMMTSYLPGLPVAGGPKQPEYYRAMIRAANAAGGLDRSINLSTYGYWCIDTTRLTPRRTEQFHVPAQGAGLWLTTRHCDASWVCEQLSECPVLPMPPLPSYA